MLFVVERLMLHSVNTSKTIVDQGIKARVKKAWDGLNYWKGEWKNKNDDFER